MYLWIHDKYNSDLSGSNSVNGRERYFKNFNFHCRWCCGRVAEWLEAAIFSMDTISAECETNKTIPFSRRTPSPYHMEARQPWSILRKHPLLHALSIRSLYLLRIHYDQGIPPALMQPKKTKITIVTKFRELIHKCSRSLKYLIGTLERIFSNKSSDKMKRWVSKAFSRRELNNNNNNNAGFPTRHSLQASSPFGESREVTQEPHAKGDANLLRSS